MSRARPVLGVRGVLGPPCAGPDRRSPEAQDRRLSGPAGAGCPPLPPPRERRRGPRTRGGPHCTRGVSARAGPSLAATSPSLSPRLSPPCLPRSHRRVAACTCGGVHADAWTTCPRRRLPGADQRVSVGSVAADGPGADHVWRRPRASARPRVTSPRPPAAPRSHSAPGPRQAASRRACRCRRAACGTTRRSGPSSRCPDPLSPPRPLAPSPLAPQARGADAHAVYGAGVCHSTRSRTRARGQ